MILLPTSNYDCKRSTKGGHRTASIYQTPPNIYDRKFPVYFVMAWNRTGDSTPQYGKGVMGESIGPIGKANITQRTSIYLIANLLRPAKEGLACVFHCSKSSTSHAITINHISTL